VTISETTGDVNPFEGLPLSRTPILAIFGGSFDPVHNGHVSLAAQVVEKRHADEILFVPARRPPHKQERELAAPEHRLEMLRLAIEPYPQFSYSDIEIQRTEGYSYTIDTLAVLTRFFPDHKLRFLMGTDSLRDLHLWHRATELVQHFDFLVYPRPGAPTPSFAELSGRFGSRNARKLRAAVMDDVELRDVSASEIRQRRRADRPIDGLCPDSVAGYIHAHDLYEAKN
jgi:nicotinate-nucleotide adenylyltransferase